MATLTKRQALLVRELAVIPGARVPWYILADAIGESATKQGKHRVQATVQNVRLKFGRDAIRTDRGFGYYVEPQP